MFLEAPVPVPIKHKVFNISQQVTQASGDLVEGDKFIIHTQDITFSLYPTFEMSIGTHDSEKLNLKEVMKTITDNQLLGLMVKMKR